MTVDVELGISATAYYLPPARRDIHYWGKKTGKPKALIERMVANGLHNYHDAAGIGVTDMACRAVEKLLAGVTIPRNEIDLLLYTHTLPTSVPATPASITEHIKQTFGFTRACGFSVAQQACASLIACLRLLKSAMRSNREIRHVVIVTADAIIGDENRNIWDYCIQSDGASACLISRDLGFNVIGPPVNHIDGRHYAGFWKTRELALHYIQTYSVIAYRLLRAAAQASGTALNEFECFIPPNQNLPVFRRLVDLARFGGEGAFFDNVSDKGHVFCSDAIINIHDLLHGNAKTFRNAIVYASGNIGAYGAFTLSQVRKAA